MHKQRYFDPIPVIATSIATGEEKLYPSITQAVEIGGFTYSCVLNCVRGSVKQHAGFTFRSAGPLPRIPCTSPRVSQAGLMRAQGLTIQQVADTMGLKWDTAQKYSKQAANLGLCPHANEERARA